MNTHQTYHDMLGVCSLRKSKDQAKRCFVQLLAEHKEELAEHKELLNARRQRIKVLLAQL